MGSHTIAPIVLLALIILVVGAGSPNINAQESPTANQKSKRPPFPSGVYTLTPSCATSERLDASSFLIKIRRFSRVKSPLP